LCMPKDDRCETQAESGLLASDSTNYMLGKQISDKQEGRT